MKKGIDILPLAKHYIGSKYVFGALVPKNITGYVGAFDCAEYVSYLVKQVYGMDYGHRNGDAYTGFFNDDAKKKGIIIPVAQAIKTPGAFLLRVGVNGSIGHIAISQGNGTTVEAHSTKYGVIESVADGRRWDYGILLPGVEYTYNANKYEKPLSSAPAIVYRLKNPMMKAKFVEDLQKALKALGYYPYNTDEYFGKNTHAAIIRFQKNNGLIVDGEVKPGGETAKALHI